MVKLHGLSLLRVVVKLSNELSTPCRNQDYFVIEW